MTELPRDRNGKLQAIAFPGGYSIRYLTVDGSTICADCANESDANDDADTYGDGWAIETPFVHWEGASMTCEECNEDMASEYGEPA
jgi:hypothetical protein